MTEKIDWNRLKIGRSQAYRSLPSVLRLPLVGSHRELLLQLLGEGQSLLDIGANDRNLKLYLDENSANSIKYYSYDIDRSNFHDYYSLSDIDRKFDFTTIFEVIEHMPVNEVYNVVESTFKLLSEDGVLIISTPNVYHPVRFWRDCTHSTPFAYDELVGILLSVGYEKFSVYRIKHRMRTKDWLVFWLYKPLLRLLGIDFAPGIAVVAHKSS